jgi:hypothetical protein
MSNLKVLTGLSIAAALVLAACGGSTAKPGGSQTATGSSSATPSSGPSIGPGGTKTVHIKTSAWYAGFKIELGDAQYVPPLKPTPGVGSFELKHGRVNIDAVFENLGTDSRNFSEALVVSSGDNNYLDATRDQKLPTVPGSKRGEGLISIYVDDKFAIESAVLTIGQAKYNQAVVPLGKTGKLVSLEPRQLTISGTLVVGESFTMNMTSGEMRADTVLYHREQLAGYRSLNLTFSVTRTGDNGSYLDASNVALKLPDGTAVAPEVSSYGSLPPKGTTETGRAAGFKVKAPADGNYTLIVKGKFGAKRADVQVEFPFTVTQSG